MPLNILIGNSGSEVLNGTSGADFIIGNEGSDRLNGFAGNDYLYGGLGSDIMEGGLGNDVYIIDDGDTDNLDALIERANEGIDTIIGSMVGTALSTFTMPAHFENLEFRNNRGLGITVTGNALGNSILTTALGDTLIGLAGNDRLNGGQGADLMQGGTGSDTYVVDNAGDIVDEQSASGVDHVISSITFSLANTSSTRGYVETLLLSGTAPINGIGNARVNSITGNNAVNILSGGAGNDTLTGNGGNDTLKGDAHNDILIGGPGKDLLVGGTGSDIFRFAAKTHSVVGVNADRILDFDDGDAGDRIDVSALFGAAMTYRHNLAFTGAGQVRINDIAGADVIVEVNIGGTLAPDFSIRLVNTTLASMNASDFVL
jgi:Ca2+-binding RTX toxin-like protein